MSRAAAELLHILGDAILYWGNPDPVQTPTQIRESIFACSIVGAGFWPVTNPACCAVKVVDFLGPFIAKWAHCS